MGIYDDMQGVASDLLAEFKQGVIRYVATAVAPGATPDASGALTVTYTVLNAVARSVSTKYVDGSHIVQSDRQVTMPGDTVTPTMDGSIEIDGVIHKIVEILPHPAAGTPVSYTVIVRQ